MTTNDIFYLHGQLEEHILYRDKKKRQFQFVSKKCPHYEILLIHGKDTNVKLRCMRDGDWVTKSWDYFSNQDPALSVDDWVPTSESKKALIDLIMDYTEKFLSAEDVWKTKKQWRQ